MADQHLIEVGRSSSTRRKKQEEGMQVVKQQAKEEYKTRREVTIR